MGTYGSRSIAVGGTAIMKALDKIIAKGKKIAAHLMEAAETDVEYDRGVYTVKGTDKKKMFGEVAFAAYVPHNYPHDKLEPGLNENAFYDPSNFTFPAGTYVCEVEVDPDTGVVDVVRWTCVDDCGRAVNPMILHGQTHGGIAAGVGQALWEDCAYAADGQMLAATFMDYALPRADALPNFTTEISEVPSTTNPLGLRGGGEGGTTPALAATINAVVDALAEFGVEHMEMPATPERVWRAIQATRRS
jgi:aerobic carbon-monoxide dehydrogenase large subunit